MLVNLINFEMNSYTVHCTSDNSKLENVTPLLKKKKTKSDFANFRPNNFMSYG